MNKLLIGLLSVATLTCGARTLIGPGDAIISSDEPLSFVDDPLALGGTAVTRYDGCLATTNVTLFRNVQLSDITNIAALAGSAWHTGKRGRWLPTTMCFYKKTDGAVECELHAQGENNLFGCHLHLEQRGADVVARITRAGHASGGSRGVGTVHFYDDAAENIVVEDELETKSGVSKVVFKNVTCQLESASVSSPNRIVFNNACTEVTNCPMISAVSEPFTNWVSTLFWKNTDLSRVTGFSAMIGGGIVDKKWKAALPCNIATNVDGSVVVRFNHGPEPVVSVRMLFEQQGDDVWAKITQAKYTYNTSDPAYNFDNPSIGGADLTVIDTESSSARFTVSIKDICCSGLSVWNERLDVDGFAATEWKSLLDNADIDEISFVSAKLAGSQLGSLDRSVTLVNVATNLDGAIDWQCQYSYDQGTDGKKLVGVALRSEQDGQAVRYRSWAHGYGWDKPIGTSTSSLAEVPLVDSTSGTGVALHNIVFSRVRKNLLPMTVAGFDCAGLPVKLANAELRIVSANPTRLTGPVYGTGAVVIDGNAEIGSGAAFTAPLALTSNGVLKIDVNAGAPASLAVKLFSAEDGATIALNAAEDPHLDAAVAWTLVPASAAGSVGQVNVALMGALSGKYRAKLSKAADGALTLTLGPKQGLLLLFR